MTLRLLMTADAVGGVWTYALDLARGLHRHGIRTTLAVTGPEPKPAQRAAARAVPGVNLLVTGLPLDWLAQGPGELEAAGRELARLAAGFDLVQLNAPALAAVAQFPVPVIAVTHSCLGTWWRTVRGTPMPEDFAWRNALHAEGLRRAQATVAPSRAFAAMTAEAHGLRYPPRPIHNGREPARLAPLRQLQAAFTAGRLWDEGKDVATLDRAAARLSAPLLAAGPTEGPNGARIALRDAVPLGHLDARGIAECLAQRPVFVSAARYEPFGLSVLEAAQAGCALVLADTPVFRELWDGAALFVPPGDEAGFAQAIGALLADPPRREARASAARGRARRYGVEAMAAGMAALIGDALRRGRAAA